MPTNTGSETINERLERLRDALVRVRITIERAESNGQGHSLNGNQVTEIAYEKALARERQLQGEIEGLERRLSANAGSTRKAIIKSVSS